MVMVVEGPGNLNLRFDPSTGTVMVTAQVGIADTVRVLPSKGIVDGLTSHPVRVPVPVGPPLATKIVVCTVTEAITVRVVDAVLPEASSDVIV